MTFISTTINFYYIIIFIINVKVSSVFIVLIVVLKTTSFSYFIFNKQIKYKYIWEFQLRIQVHSSGYLASDQWEVLQKNCETLQRIITIVA